MKDSTIRIRQGAGTDYDVIGGLVSGTCIRVLGRNQDSSWVFIVTNENINGWVAAWLLTVDGNLDSVPIQKNSENLNNILLSQPTSPTVRVIPPQKTNTPQPVFIQPTLKNSNCSPAYPTVCIPPRPPDLDCKDIPHKRFKVLPPDPHNFDRDGDGIGCES